MPFSPHPTQTISTPWLVALLAAVLWVGGCDTDFDPIQESDLHFSVFGFLDAAGPDWPDFLTIDDETLALADVVTNVENGVGFIGGVSRKTMPWADLRDFLVSTQPVCVECASLLPNPALCFGG